MGFEFSFKNKRLVKYIIVLAAAIIARILFAVFMSIEAQKYIGLIIIPLAIAAFFTWDYIDRRGNQK